MKTGGGIQSSINRKVGVKVGSRTTQVVNPGGLSQLGAAQGGKLRREGSFTGVNSAKNVFDAPRGAATRMGNDLAASVKAGPGGSRTVMRSGTQGRH
jgi:hypothetical protein